MPRLTINGQKVTVNDAFLKLSPDEQDATVDEIAADIARGNRSSLGVSVPETPAQAAPQSSSQVPSFDAMGNPTGGMEAAAPASGMSYGDSMAKAGDAFINGAVRVSRGLPFSDRAAAFTRSAVTGKPYADELAALREAADRDKAANPGMAATGQVAGAMLTAPAGAMGLLGKGASLFEKARAGAVAGAAFGGVQGASESPDLTDVGGRGETNRCRCCTRCGRRGCSACNRDGSRQHIPRFGAVRFKADGRRLARHGRLALERRHATRTIDVGDPWP